MKDRNGRKPADAAEAAVIGLKSISVCADVLCHQIFILYEISGRYLLSGEGRYFLFVR